ncbi:excinuclease ABC subunit UvrC [Oleidesulfovibrio sp.]|uniref:excinuclease ABC subunit UvrC n=1 Tax=Oleidesulfovibrio sp. TaxID=2909707 RepID=UPI003A892165
MDQLDISLIPTTPGVYLYKDATGKVVYVGKAKHLRRRVASYFRDMQRHTPKTRAMLRSAETVETLSTTTEKEALLLEASLIKKHRPRYNILLRDDKQYVLFQLTKKHHWPRLVLTRRVRKDGSAYFGPFTSSQAARQTWKAIHKVFPLRRCSDKAFNNRVRPCLYHFMNQCPGPCVLDVSREDYMKMVHKVEMLLTGRSSELMDILRNDMEAASEALEFETAAVLRDQLQAIERTVERQAAILPGVHDMDAVGLAEAGGGLALSVLFIRRSVLLDKRNFFWPGLTLEEGPEVLLSFLSQYYGPGSFVPPRVLVPWDIRHDEHDDEEGAPAAVCLPPTEQAGSEHYGADSVEEAEAVDSSAVIANSANPVGQSFGQRGSSDSRQDTFVNSALAEAQGAHPRASVRTQAAALTGMACAVGNDKDVTEAESDLFLLCDDKTGERAAGAGPETPSASDHLSLAPAEPATPAVELRAETCPYESLVAADTAGSSALPAVAEMLSELRGAPVRVLPPRNATENQLVTMATENAREDAKAERRPDVASVIAAKLGMKTPPVRIEAVDVSHTGGRDTRVGVVVFENGAPAKDQYRTYAFADEDAGGDDTGVLAQWAVRRVQSGPPWPDLLLVDGGRGQLNAVMASLEQCSSAELFAVASIAKARDEETGRADRRAGNISDRIFLPGRSNPVNFKSGSPELLFLQHVRDTVHDYSIGRHRKARSGAALSGELLRMPGIGPSTAKLLWEHFASLQEMVDAGEKGLAALPGIGKAKAKVIYQGLKRLVG